MTKDSSGNRQGGFQSDLFVTKKSTLNRARLIANYWQGRQYADRTFFDEIPGEARI
jgi:hypothetical protein